MAMPWRRPAISLSLCRRKIQNKSEKNMVKLPSSPATAPFAHKVGDGRPPKQGKWQHWQTGPTISMHIASPTLYTESNLDFLPSGDFLCEILQIPISSSGGETSGVKRERVQWQGASSNATDPIIHCNRTKKSLVKSFLRGL